MKESASNSAEEKRIEEYKEKIREADRIIDELDSITYERAEMLRTGLERTTSNISETIVTGGSKLHSREDALLLLAEMTSMLDKSDRELKNIYKKIPKEDRNLRIYFDKVFFHKKTKDLVNKYDLTRQHINRIIKKIKKNL